MDSVRLGAAFRAVRHRLRLRLADVAARAGVSVSTVSRIERGQLASLSVSTLERVAAVLEIRLDLVPRWRGGELDRTVGSGHAAMHDQVARLLRDLPGWSFAPEVTFAVYGERGIIDVLAFHPARSALLVIELKTELVDVQALLGQVDRYRRLSRRIARERGWHAQSVGVWVALRGTMTNRRRVTAHAAVLRAALPDEVRAVRRWLRDPVGPLAGLTFVSDSHARTASDASHHRKRIRSSQRTGA